MKEKALHAISKVLEWLVTIAICYGILVVYDNELSLAILLGAIIYKLMVLTSTKHLDEWISTEDKMPEPEQRVLVKKFSGAVHYAVYSADDEFDVHQPAPPPLEYRQSWYKFSSRTIVEWKPFI